MSKSDAFGAIVRSGCEDALADSLDQGLAKSFCAEDPSFKACGVLDMDGVFISFSACSAHHAQNKPANASKVAQLISNGLAALLAEIFTMVVFCVNFSKNIYDKLFCRMLLFRFQLGI